MSKAAIPYRVEEYLSAEGASPFREWLDGLARATRARISARIARFEAGNLGDAKSLGDGIWEARFTLGPGYRVYFGIENGRLILLLAGGDKGSQQTDIKEAKRRWKAYLEADDG